MPGQTLVDHEPTTEGLALVADLRHGVGGVVDLLACSVTSARNSDTSNLNVLWGMGVVKPILVECNAMHVESPVILLVIARTRVQANSREIRSRGEQ